MGLDIMSFKDDFREGFKEGYVKGQALTFIEKVLFVLLCMVAGGIVMLITITFI